MRRDGDIFAATVAGAGAGNAITFAPTATGIPDKVFSSTPPSCWLIPMRNCWMADFPTILRLGQRGEDTALLVPKAVVADSPATQPLLPPLFKPGGLIYELNVQGFSRDHPEVPPALQRGTIAALAQPGGHRDISRNCA